ncbi:hypothetical protein DL98DRAFT_652209 [Cadophora sp. DSE1049]|nr:hypothetical protein DL98DRAFT_652209 [Cadophora sp. DSE1049]
MSTNKEAVSTVEDDVHDIAGPKPSDDDKKVLPSPCQTKRLFWIRTMTCILLPPSFAAYYVWTYIKWLKPGNDATTNVYTMSFNGKYIWWSWFVIGALGLNISNYSLSGVEAGMFISNHFKLDIHQLEFHAEKSWSTLGGWKVLGISVWTRRKLTIPWALLFGLSVLSWTFVLSGLTMNTSKSWAFGHRAGIAVSGVNETTMNTRTPARVYKSALQLWQTGAEPRLPKMGTFYSKPGHLLHANFSGSNTLPANVDDEIFLGPQANVPLSGTAWGMAIKYSCKGIHRLSDFAVLNRRLNSSSPGYVRNYSSDEDANASTEVTNVNFFYELEDGASISTLSQLSSGASSPDYMNFHAFAEIGLSPGFRKSLQWVDYGYGVDNHSGTERPSHGGLEEEEVLEFLLWQHLIISYVVDDVKPVQHPIPGLNGQHLSPLGESMFAIGARCTSSSVTGKAKINGLAGLFTEFTRVDPVPSIFSDVARFGIGASSILLPGRTAKYPWGIYIHPSGVLDASMPDDFPSMSPLGVSLPDNSTFSYTLVDTGINWLRPLFTSIGVQNTQAMAGAFFYHSYMQTEDLVHAIQQAYKHYAVQLMYNGQEGPMDGWSHQNLTGAVERFVLVDGEGVPPLLVLICFVTWACGCVGLGLVYGMIRREDATFNASKYHEHAE